ncbi:cerebellar degeneration-related protein 2-like isoform X3 [Amphibalanus amphitrite]|uniref:cerebellar degeneration-related protein 2-like isoform X3 n=1 Tax=Amphibalanus amphitrite TaxID=1232801 RepID=UPI001C921102|nr:cerebellar degeneration-related protein 2-like isoform X3 [Amphibalanus amphitrite]
MALAGGLTSAVVGTEPGLLPGGTRMVSEAEGSGEPSCVHLCEQGTCVMHDLQLAAELGKTLLERNKELETGLKQQQTVIDDQSQEIEYLSKQSVALREVNDSRLRVYEQLEVSIQELEVTNQRLQDDSARDKKRIRSLTQSVECLEQRTAELQTLVDELRAAERTYRAAAAAAAGQGDEDEQGDSETRVPSTSDQLAERVTLLEQQLTEVRERERKERERRQWAEMEVATAQQECSELRHEMAALRERSVKLHTLAEEVHALEEHRLSPFMRHCSPRASSASPQMAGESRAAGSASADRARSVWGEDAGRLSSAAEDAGSAPASLISDLDAHYRVLLDHMDKYEWMVSSRPVRPPTPDQPSSLSLLEELQLSAAAADQPPAALRATPLRDSGPASLMLLGAPSDGDASSSGFSEGSDPSRAVSRATQTPDGEVTALSQRKATGTLQHSTQYKQLFQEIFQVLKKPVLVSPALGSIAAPVAASASQTAEGTPASTSSASPAVAPATDVIAESLASKEQAEVEEVNVSQAVPATETSKDSRVAATSAERESSAVEMSLRTTLPAEPSEETVPPLPQSPGDSETLSRSSRSRSASVPRAFSFAEEYERRLRESTPSTDGCADSSPGVASSGEEFPLLVRPSEEVAKLRLLERSYAEALKAGRRCFYRPTLL